MNIEETIRNTVEKGCEHTPINDCILIRKEYYDQLVDYVQELDKAQKKQQKIEELKKQREVRAQECFESDGLEGNICVDSDTGWEKDGDDIYLKTFYIENEEDRDGDSLKATYIVEFKPNTATIIDNHFNIHSP